MIDQQLYGGLVRLWSGDGEPMIKVFAHDVIELWIWWVIALARRMGTTGEL